LPNLRLLKGLSRAVIYGYILYFMGLQLLNRIMLWGSPKPGVKECVLLV